MKFTTCARLHIKNYTTNLFNYLLFYILVLTESPNMENKNPFGYLLKNATRLQ